MTLRDRLSALVSAAPADATVPVHWLAELLALEPDASAVTVATSTAASGVDLTVHDVAERFEGRVHRPHMVPLR